MNNEEIISKLNEKIYELERLNKKYENILDEKSTIIINKADEIEALNDKIEELTKQLEKTRPLNVIQECFCAKCGNSLEESFLGESINDNKKIIQEQNTIIEQQQIELNKMKLHIQDYDQKLKDLDEIKTEFNLLSEKLLQEKVESSTQTDPPTNNTNNNKKPLSKKNSTRPSTASTTSKKKQNISNNTNVNITINNNSNNNTSIFSNKSNNSFSSSISGVNGDGAELKDALTSLRFDNSVLSNELLNINKECNRLRAENRIINEKNMKSEKEKNELIQKHKQKCDNFDKLKKEKEELMVLIQNSKYKNIISTENENKKYKERITQIENELSNERILKEDYEKKLYECQLLNDKMKKTIEGFNTFNEQKENLILQNAKYETELKRCKYDLEEAKQLIDKQNIIITSKEKDIQKYTNDVNYYAFNLKKAKQDAERAMQDTITYQQIVRKMEAQLTQMQQTVIGLQKAKLANNNNNQNINNNN